MIITNKNIDNIFMNFTLKMKCKRSMGRGFLLYQLQDLCNKEYVFYILLFKTE